MRLLLTLLLSTLLPAPAGAGESAGLEIADAWLRQPPPGRDMAALYMQLRNASDKPVELDGVRVTGARDASIHRNVEENGMIGMRHVDVLELRPGEELRFEPGGYHVMVFGLGEVPQAGQELEFCLHLRDGAERCAPARVRGLEED